MAGNQTQEMTLRFMDALQNAELTGDTQQIAHLFSDDAILTNFTLVASQGAAGADRFWKKYLSNFQNVESRFVNTLTGAGFSVLEWESRGTLRSGREFSYQGVSILEIGDGGISRFVTYYDSAALNHGMLPSDVSEAS